MNRLTQRILSYQQGGHNAEALVEQFLPLLLHYADLLCAEDGFEELRLCLLEALNKLPVAQLPQDNPDWAALSYLKKAVYHRYIALSRESRARQARAGGSPEELPQEEHSPEQLAVRQLVRLLPARQREVIALHFYQGYREYEIAQRLGISRQAVNQLKKRALRSLREWLRD